MPLFPVKLEAKDEFTKWPTWGPEPRQCKLTAGLLTKIFYLMDKEREGSTKEDPWENTQKVHSTLVDLDKVLPGWDNPGNVYGLSKKDIEYLKKEPVLVGECFLAARLWDISMGPHSGQREKKYKGGGNMKYFMIYDHVWFSDGSFITNNKQLVIAKDEEDAKNRYARSQLDPDDPYGENESLKEALLRRERVRIKDICENDVFTVEFKGVKEIPEEHFKVLEQGYLKVLREGEDYYPEEAKA